MPAVIRREHLNVKKCAFYDQEEKWLMMIFKPLKKNSEMEIMFND